MSVRRLPSCSTLERNPSSSKSSYASRSRSFGQRCSQPWPTETTLQETRASTSSWAHRPSTG
eukprot:45532-Prymnesium_polylepis.1